MGRKAAINQAETLSIKYCTTPANALEETGKGSVAKHERNIQILEEYLTLARRIKNIEGKFRKPGTTVVIQLQTNGRTLEITYKIPLEKVIIEENLKNYHQTKGA